MSMLARTAAVLGQFILNTLVFPNGRRVHTTLHSTEAVETYERNREFDMSYDWDRYGYEPRNSHSEIIEELTPVKGSLWEMVQNHGMDIDEEEWLYLDWVEENETRDAVKAEAIVNALENEMYARLERPRKRRLKALPEYHTKRLGHREANRFGTWSDALDRQLGLGNYKRYPRPDVA